MNAKNAWRCTGIHFVGMMWFKIIVHGIVKHAENVKIGENGIVKYVINVHME
ncbi:MAG: hypothetical protein C5S45_03985 [Candidatus Methanocomedens sp.]|nr:MAG: hypothetical protein C5S45_03985 [ANME-2 cluster archaeon]